MPNEEPMYCSQQINIPPELPDILKQFTKAAIRTQPADVLAWSASYFEALAAGDKPPVKERLDYQLGSAVQVEPTLESLKVLHRQLGDAPTVEASKVQEKWQSMCLDEAKLKHLMSFGSFAEEFNWLHFLTCACGDVTKDFTLALKAVCEIITKDLEGGPARIAFNTFKELYTYLSKLDGDVPSDHVNEVIEHLTYDVEKQGGMIGPRNFMNDTCPRLNGPERGD